MIKNHKNNANDFITLMQPYMRHINHTAFRLTGNMHDTEDLVQEFLIKIYPRKEQFNQGQNIKPWLTKVLYNTYIDIWRKQKNNPTCKKDNINFTGCDESDEQFNHHICNTLCPEQLTALSETQQELMQLLFSLNNEQRLVLVMHDIEGYSLPELTNIMHVPLGTLKSRLHRARDKMRNLLNDKKVSHDKEVAEG